MEDIQDLKRKINKMLLDREMPEDLKNMIMKVEQEYEDVCKEFLSQNIDQQDLGKVIERAIDYSRENGSDALMQVKKFYGKDCEEKLNEVIGAINTIERKMEERKVSISEQEERFSEAVGDKGRTYRKAGRISDIVIDSLQNSRNQLMRNLESIKTPEQQREYLYQKIKLIENKTRMSFGNQGMDILLEDDKQIVDSVLAEYQQYKEEKDISQNKSEGEIEKQEDVSESQRFREEIRIEQKELKPLEEVRKEQEEVNKNRKVLPSDILR